MNTEFKKALIMVVRLIENNNNISELYNSYCCFRKVLLDNMNLNRRYSAYDRHIFPFKDYAYIIYDYKDENRTDWNTLINLALLNSEPLLMVLLSKGVVCKGAAAFGKVFYDDKNDIFFGEGIEKVNHLEQKSEKLPVILLDNYIADLVKPLYLEKNSNIKQSVNGYYYLNMFKSVQDGLDYSLITNKSNKALLDDIINICKNNLKNKDEDCYKFLLTYAEQSRNDNIIGKMIPIKPLQDAMLRKNEYIPKQINPSKMLTKMSFGELKSLNILPNIGCSFDFKEMEESFEKFLKENKEIMKLLDNEPE